MTWVRLEDAFAEHPKVVGLSDRAFRVLVEAMCYAARLLTDGRVPGTVIDRHSTPKVRRELVDAGLLEPIAGGYAIHDFLTYNPTRAEVEERREQKRSAGRAGGLARAKAHAKAPAQAESNPVPQPLPEPQPQHQEPPTANREPRPTPTHDAVYLAEKINARWEATKGRLTPAGLQQILNGGCPPAVLEDVIRELHGFPPEEAVRSPFAYLQAMVADRMEGATA